MAKPPAPSLKATPKLQIDLTRYRTFVAGKFVKLPPKEFLLLSGLAKAKGRVLSRGDLLEAYYNSDGARDIDTRTIDQHIARLRKSLGRAATIIETVTGVGYRAEGIEILDEQDRWGTVHKITRVFRPKKTGAFVMVRVDGDVMPNLREGHKFKIPA